MIDSQERPDWGEAASAYDAIAVRYDRIAFENPINASLRRRSVERLLATFREGERVIEIGCGTGEEALALASQGVHVVALDPSEEMLRVARHKAVARALDPYVTFVRGSGRNVLDAGRHEGGPFDGGYASFSLAYEPLLDPIAHGLAALLRPGARFLASLPSRICMVEWAVALGSGRPSFAGRRLRPWHGHKVGESRVPIRAYTPGSVVRAMGPAFRLKRIEALTALLPPPYMYSAIAPLRKTLPIVERLDESLRRKPPFRALGDHFLVELERVP